MGFWDLLIRKALSTFNMSQQPKLLLQHPHSCRAEKTRVAAVSLKLLRPLADIVLKIKELVYQADTGHTSRIFGFFGKWNV